MLEDKNKQLLRILAISVVLTSFLPYANLAFAVDPTFDLLVVGGGGGGGGAKTGSGSLGGGGGAGSGFDYFTGITAEVRTYTVTVGGGAGAGSSGSASSSTDGGTGGTSVFDGVYSQAGGAGGKAGKTGGASAGSVGSNSTGGNGGSANLGSGGAGTANSITGTSLTYGGGGGAGTVGSGVGGFGSCTSGLGCGGGGRSTLDGGTAGTGGVVIIRYLTADMTATGGTITTDGAYTVHKFTSSGTFEVTEFALPTPTAPLNPSITNTGTHTATGTWDTPTDADNLLGYRVYLNGEVYVNNTGTSDTSINFVGLDSGTLQTMIVQAWNATGAGDNSTEATDYTINTPPVLDKVNVVNDTAFELFYTINGTYNGIRIDFEEFGGALETVLANSTSSAVSYIFNGTSVAIDTIVSIFAHNLGGTSAVSNEITNATNTPEVPVISSSAQTTSTITLAMASNNTGSSYNVLRSPSGCESFQSIINSTTTPYIASGLNATTTYCFQAESVNAYGNSTGSSFFNATTSSVSESSSPPVTGGGSGLGGGAGIPTQPEFSDTLIKLSLVSTFHKLQLGQKISGDMLVTWNSPDEFKVTSITVDENSNWFGFRLTPFTLVGFQGISEGKIPYTIEVPKIECSQSAQITFNCAELKLFKIPVTITGEVGSEIVKTESIITLDLSNDIQPVTMMMLIIFTGSIGFIAFRAYNTNNPNKTRLDKTGKKRPRKGKDSFMNQLGKLGK